MPREDAEQPVRVVRVIARLNMGGPAHHVTLLSGHLDRRGYDTLLVHGRLGEGESGLDDLVRRHGVRHLELSHLGPELRPLSDAAALWRLIGVMRRERPHVVHTHTAKAGMLGRMAARLALGRDVVVVHTFHGHVLEGYFGPVLSGFYRALERALARISDALIGVSEATVDDLVRLGVAPRERFRVVPLGLDLDALLAIEGGDRPLRAQAGASDADTVLLWLGRLVPIKRVDVLLRAVAAARADGARCRLALIGDGPERPQLEALAAELGIADAVWFAGYRDDVAAAVASADVAVLSSANEGTPVSLIEAAAGGLPLVATDVGGVRDIVVDGTGVVVPEGDHVALGEAIARLASDRELRGRMGAAARAHVAARYRYARLLDDVDALYRELLTRRGAPAGRRRRARRSR